jgi:hypothetical protein
MRAVLPLAATIVIAALSPALAVTSNPAKVEQTSIGKVLANNHGMTLYTFSNGQARSVQLHRQMRSQLAAVHRFRKCDRGRTLERDHQASRHQAMGLPG